MKVMAKQPLGPSYEQHVVDDDGADDAEEANFHQKEGGKDHRVHDEGDDNDDEAMTAQVIDHQKALDSQKPMSDDASTQKSLESNAVQTGSTQHAEHEDIFAQYRHMPEDEFNKMVEETTRPIMDSLMNFVEEHTKQLYEEAEKDPKKKAYMELYGDAYYKIYAKQRDEEKKNASRFKVSEDDRVDTKDVSLLEQLREKQQQTQHKEVEATTEQKSQPKEVEDESPQVDRKLLKEEVDRLHAESGLDPGAQMKELEKAWKDGKQEAVASKHQSSSPQDHGKNSKDDEEGDSLPETSAAQTHVEMDADHEEEAVEHEVSPRSAKRSAGTIRQHKKTAQHKGSSMEGKQIRSAQVDAAGNIISAVADPAVRGEDEPVSYAEPGAPDVDSSPQKEQQPSESAKSTKDELALAKRAQYISMAGFAVAVLVIAWMLVRRRAQQLIDRADAFDDASSVSSSTMTEENPTVKVNRALLERMATISQKLSEKVEEARSSGNSQTSSELDRGYRRDKKNPQDS